MEAKLLWNYVCDHCDNIGLVEIDLDLVSSDFRGKVKQSHLDELRNRVVPIGEMKYFIPKFIKFQYGKLSESCPAHKKVIQAVEDHGLLHDSLGYYYPNATLPSRDTIPYSTGKEEKEDSIILNIQELPFDSPAFLSAWEDWKTFRTQKRAKLTPITIKQQFKTFSEWGELRSIKAIEHSISQGYTGLFEPKQANNQTQFKGLQEEIDIP